MRFQSFHTEPRTQPTIAAGGSACEIWIDANSLGKNFPTGWTAVLGGRLHYAYSQVLGIDNLGGQNIPSGGPTVLRFNNVPSKDLNTRYGTTWSASTGRIIVPLGGWRAVRLALNINVSAVRPNSEISVTIDGAATGGYSSTGAGKFVQEVYELGDLLEGQTIEVRFVNLDTAFIAGNSANDFFENFRIALNGCRPRQGLVLPLNSPAVPVASGSS